MYIIKKNEAIKIAEELARTFEVYGPQVDAASGQVFFDRASDLESIDLSAPIPSLSPKNIVLSQHEKIFSYRYKSGDKNVEIKKFYQEKPKALFGIRSCDLTGLQCLDRFFLGQEFVDDIFLSHRRSMFIVANTCISPFTQCFCACTDSGPSAREGFDLNLTEAGEYYLVETGSDRGKDLVKKLALKEASKDHSDMKKAVLDKSISLFDEVATENKAWISRVMKDRKSVV
jgi:sulfhydrogenase subunit beta (sulfur reductase)